MEKLSSDQRSLLEKLEPSNKEFEINGQISAIQDLEN
jgi:hypothetical protein